MIDEKAAFYLRHRKEIEEWSALRSSAARLVDETLVSRFSDWSGDVDGTVRSTEDLLDGAWPRVYCARREWREQGLRLAVVFEWNRSRLLGSSRAPYLGVRVPNDQPQGKQLHELLKARRPALRDAGLVTSSDYWPAWRWLEVPDDAEALPAYADRCATELEEAWTGLRDLLDEVARQAQGSAAQTSWGSLP